jgi:hypothetical protein
MTMVTSISAILLGIINIAIVVVVLLLVGVLAWWIFTSLLHIGLPGEVRTLYLALVALIALYMIVALLLGLPSVTLFRS